MSTIVTRAGKGSALTWTEADANFTNLNNDKAELVSPTFTGTPSAPTAVVGTNTTQVATTAYTKAEIASDRPYSDTNPLMDSTAAQGSSPKVSRQDHVHPSDTSRVTKAGDTMTGNLNVPSLNGGQLAGFRNRLINGDMRIMQRAGHTPLLGSIDFFADRWFLYSQGAANASVTWVSTPTGGPNSNKHYLSIVGASGNTLTALRQRIEAENCADLKSKVVSVSALVYTQDSRAVAFEMRYPTARDNWSGNVLHERDVTSAASGWRTITTQMTMPANTFGIEIGLDFGAVGAGLEMAATDIQFEEGPVATPFESRPITTEELLCFRYYYRQTAPSSYSTMLGCGQAMSGTNFADCIMELPVPMRKYPTLETGAANTFSLGGLAGTVTSISLYTQSATEQSKKVLFRLSISPSTFASNSAVYASTTTYMGLSAEL